MTLLLIHLQERRGKVQIPRWAYERRPRSMDEKVRIDISIQYLSSGLKTTHSKIRSMIITTTHSALYWYCTWKLYTVWVYIALQEGVISFLISHPAWGDLTFSSLTRIQTHMLCCLSVISPEPPALPKEEEEWSDTPSDVFHLTDGKFDEFMEKNPSVLVMFYAPCKYEVTESW